MAPVPPPSRQISTIRDLQIPPRQNNLSSAHATDTMNNSNEGPSVMVTPATQLTALIKKKMEKLLTIPYNPCIYKIPRDLRSVNEKAYTPCRVAIGPYHANDPALKSMEQHKLRCLKDLISRGSCSIKDYVEAISEDVLSRARQYYADVHDLSSDRFAEILLIDGAFIIEFFFSIIEKSRNHGNNVNMLVQNERTMMEIKRDLLILENQLPYFILELLFEFTFWNKKLLSLIAGWILGSIIPIERGKDVKSKDVTDRTAGTDILHLVHLITLLLQERTGEVGNSQPPPHHPPNRDLSLPRSPSPPHPLPPVVAGMGEVSYLTRPTCIPNSRVVQPSEGSTNLSIQASISATELHEAGVTFKRKNPDHKSLKIKFSGGVLEMPHLTLDDFTESFFRNLMAFEQYYLNTYDITSYMYFMDHLIDTVKDVQILQKSNVVENWLESKDNVTIMFNTISRHTITDFSPELRQLIKDMKQYARRPWNEWKAMLRRDYFGSPWAVISFLAALTLLILTFLQAYASLRQSK